MSLTEHPTTPPTAENNVVARRPMTIPGVDENARFKVWSVHMSDGHTMIGVHADALRFEGRVLQFLRFGQPVHSFNLDLVLQVSLDGAQRPRSADLKDFHVQTRAERFIQVQAERVDLLANHCNSVWLFSTASAPVEAFVVANCIRMVDPSDAGFLNAR